MSAPGSGGGLGGGGLGGGSGGRLGGGASAHGQKRWKLVEEAWHEKSDGGVG